LHTLNKIRVSTRSHRVALPPAHLLGELFKLETGVETTHVPYAQFPQAIADLLSGVNAINSGQLRALAVMSRKRIPALKDVPTILEAALPKARRGGLGRPPGQVWDTAGGDRAPQRGREQGAWD
jgi:hypothetical protein